MDYIDSHCHIHSTDWPFDAKQSMKLAKDSGVSRVFCIGTSINDSRHAIEFAEKYPGAAYAVIGVHPHAEGFSDASSTFLGSSKQLAKLVRNPTVIAIGEIGLDYHYKPFDRDSQIKLMEEQLALAAAHSLPVVFHVREAFDDIWPVLDNFPNIQGVMHSFSDDEANLHKSLDRSFYVGVNGLATFTNIPLPPLDRMLLETDAPFLAPPPFRGKPNQPAYIPYIAQYLSQKLNLPLAEIATKTTSNTETLFHLV